MIESTEVVAAGGISRRTGAWISGIAAIMAMSVALGSVAAANDAPERPGTLFDPGAVAVTTSQKLAERFGVRLIGLRRTAADNMLDFRYQLVDVSKAATLLDRKSDAYLIVEKNGGRLFVPDPPKIGALRQTPRNPRPNSNLFVMFGNPGRTVQAGDRVTVVIGDFRAEHVVVQ